MFEEANENVPEFDTIGTNNKIIREIQELRQLNEHLNLRLKNSETFREELGAEKDRAEQALEKKSRAYSEKIAQMDVQIRSLGVNVEVLTLQLKEANDLNEKYAKQIESCQEELRAERDRSIYDPLNNSAIIHAESTIDVLKTKLKNAENEQKRMSQINLDLQEQIDSMETKVTDQFREIEDLRNYNEMKRNELKESSEKITALEMEIHELKTDIHSSNFAAQGNSLFGEVMDGRKKQDEAMRVLHREREKLRRGLDKALKMLHEYTIRDSKTATLNSKNNGISGPSLFAFQTMSERLKQSEEEKKALLDKVHAYEANEIVKLNDLVNHKNSDYILRQVQQFHAEELRAKHRCETRIAELEMINRDLLDVVGYERARAASVPELEGRIQTMSHVISQYETDIFKSLSA